jgi:VanZ family protein
MNRRHRSFARALAPLALMGAIFFLSSQPADEGLAWWGVVARKLGHIGGYALLTALWAWALTGVTRRPVAVAALIALLYAATDEYHQSFVDTRNGSPIDVGIDAVGIAIAALALNRWGGQRSAGRSPRPSRRAEPSSSPS